MSGLLYEFGRFRLDAGSRVLFCAGERVPITPKAVDVLVELVQRRGTPVAREELLNRVWSDSAVEEGTLSSHISLLRKTLGSNFIETIPKRGYRFVGAVAERHRAAVRSAGSRILLAVLPFENLTGSRRHDPFSDGLTEEMITQLGKASPKRLGVIARTSSMTYKATDKTIEQIGRELGVSHILEGTARRAGNRVRITAQLIQVSDQTHVWTDSYDAELEDILALQGRIAREVAQQIQITLLSGSEPRQVVPAAYEACLKGRYLWDRRTEQDLQASLRCYQEAIERDPQYATAWCGMADVYLTLMDHGYLSPIDGTVAARPLLLKALTIDPSLAEAHSSLAHAALHEFDWTSAQQGFERALQLNPSYATARHYFANLMLVFGRFDEAVKEAEHARRLDPVSPTEQSNVASVRWFARDYEGSLAAARALIALDPNYSRGYEDLGRALTSVGAFDEAIDVIRTTPSQSHGMLAALGYTYALAGKTDDARAILSELMRVRESAFLSAYSLALVNVGLGETDATMDWLERAYDERSSAIPFIKANPRFDGLHGHARFQALIGRLKL